MRTTGAAIVLVIALESAVIRVLVVTVAAAAVLSIGLSRLYLGVHWLTDVFAGWLLGGAWLALCCTALVFRTGSLRGADPPVDAPPVHRQPRR